jgi:hypothetical protein
MSTVSEEEAAIRAVVEGLLKSKEATLVTELSLVRAAQASLAENANSPTYRVLLNSMWADEGGKSVDIRGKGPLRRVMKRAEGNFMEMNGKNDIQARCHVFAVFDAKGKNAYSLPLPEASFNSLRR